MDSCAALSGTPVRNNFTTITPPPLKNIETADNNLMPVHGQGDIVLIMSGKQLPLLKTLYIPKLGHPLASVGQIARLGYQCVFGRTDALSFIAKEGELHLPLFPIFVIHTEGDGVLYKISGSAMRTASPRAPTRATTQLPTPIPRQDTGLHSTHMPTKPSPTTQTHGAPSNEQPLPEPEEPHGLLFPHEKGAQARDVPKTWKPCVMAVRASSPYLNSAAMLLWHQRVAHICERHMRYTALPGVVRDFLIEKGPSNMKGCAICAFGKMQRYPYRVASPTRASRPLEYVHMDLMGPLEKLGLKKGKYLMVIVDDATSFVWTFPLHAKNDAEKRFLEWFTEQETQLGKTPKGIKSDRGGEFLSNIFRDWLAERGIYHDLSCSYSPEQNGKAERMNRTLTEMVRCMLIGAGVPKMFWEFAYDNAAWIKNRFVTSKRKDITPWELLTGEKPSLGRARVFGCMAQVYIPKKDPERASKAKLSPRAKWGMCLGPASHAAGWNFRLENGAIIQSRDAHFDETLSYKTWRSMNKVNLDLKDFAPEDLESTRALLGLPTIQEEVEDTNEGDWAPEEWAAPPSGDALPTSDGAKSPTPPTSDGVLHGDAGSALSDVLPTSDGVQSPVTPTGKGVPSADAPGEVAPAVVHRPPAPTFTEILEGIRRETEKGKGPDLFKSEGPESNPADPGPSGIKGDAPRYPTRERRPPDTFKPGIRLATTPLESIMYTEEEPDSVYGACTILWWKPMMGAAYTPNFWKKTTAASTPHHSTFKEEHFPPIPDQPPMDWKEPETWKQALKCPYAPKWLSAMGSEVAQITERGVYVLEHAPKGTLIMGIKWVFVRKTKVDKSLDKFKARSCVQGYKSIEGIHHFDTYSPTACSSTARTLLAVGTTLGWMMHHLDVTGAFLYADLEQLIYCFPPPGFEDPEGRCWRLKKALYGLKQAPRQWMKKLKEVLERGGFTQSKADPSLFMIRMWETILFLLAFVDDFLLLTPSERLLTHVKEMLKENFEMTDLGPVQKYLGWHIHRDITAGKLWISLGAGVPKCLQNLGISLTQFTSTPLPTDWQLKYPHETDPTDPQRRPDPESGHKYSELLNETQHNKYRQGVGYINYAAMSVRPDMSFASSQLSQALDKPRERHYKGMVHALKYLNGTHKLSICYDAWAPRNLVTYTDSDYAGCKGTRKSVSGCILIYAGGPVAWSSKKQDNITLSATEAEYVAMTQGIKDTMWLRTLLHEFGLPQTLPTPVKVDNMGAVHIARNPVTSHHSRHVAVSMHYAREKNGVDIDVQHIGAADQRADYLTKALGGPQHAQALKLAGQRDMPV